MHACVQRNSIKKKARSDYKLGRKYLDTPGMHSGVEMTFDTFLKNRLGCELTRLLKSRQEFASPSACDWLMFQVQAAAGGVVGFKVGSALWARSRALGTVGGFVIRAADHFIGLTACLGAWTMVPTPCTATAGFVTRQCRCSLQAGAAFAPREFAAVVKLGRVPLVIERCVCAVFSCTGVLLGWLSGHQRSLHARGFAFPEVASPTAQW